MKTPEKKNNTAERKKITQRTNATQKEGEARQEEGDRITFSRLLLRSYFIILLLFLWQNFISSKTKASSAGRFCAVSFHSIERNARRAHFADDDDMSGG
jgi:hypothetical protein